ncbi:16S rRNA (guanine(527)-N(7))-methyltransferase RsmG [soil metagenome]
MIVRYFPLKYRPLPFTSSHTMSQTGIELIYQHFPNLNAKQKERFEALPALYAEWNEKINVISRKDIENLYDRHVLHSLAIAKLVTFNPGAEILDVGTGGGFPGIPLAIMFPDTLFYLTDSIGKKIVVVQAIKDALGLDNVFADNIRSERHDGHVDFAITRAVAPMPDLVQWTRGKIKKRSNHTLANGLITLKGGDLTTELEPYGKRAKVFPLKKYFNDPFYAEKYAVYLAL